MMEQFWTADHLTGAGRGLLVVLPVIVFMAGTGWYVARTVMVSEPMVEAGPVPLIDRTPLLALTDHRGQQLTPAALEKPATLVFFGDTHCPDICPLELATMAAALA